VEYPERCLLLLDKVEVEARKQNLIGSLVLLVASAAFMIPFERMKGNHPMRRSGDDELVKALRGLDRSAFLTAPFWACADPGSWKFSRIMDHANDTWGWVDEDGNHPMADRAKNSIEKRKADAVCE
jgi:hypothetical protein